MYCFVFNILGITELKIHLDDGVTNCETLIKRSLI